MLYIMKIYSLIKFNSESEACGGLNELQYNIKSI